MRVFLFNLQSIWLVCAINDIILLPGKFHIHSFVLRTKRGFLSFDKNTRFFVIRLVLPNYEIFLAESLKQVFFGRSFGYALFAFLRWFQWIIKAKHVVLQGIVTLPHIRPTRSLNRQRTVTLLVSKGFKYFGTGGALGFDTLAAQAVLSVKETHPEVKLILVLPCENQTKFWKQQDIDVYNDIKLRADKVKVLAPHYYNGCMQKRNRHLVDCSSACICFLTKHEGGTAYTVDYAKQNGLYLINVADRCRQT